MMSNPARTVSLLALLAIGSLAGLAQGQDPLSLTQSQDGHVVAHLSGEACAPIRLIRSSTSFTVWSDTSVCTPSGANPPSAQMDMGLLNDGIYAVGWSFSCGGFGVCGPQLSQRFSIQGGRLLAPPVANYPGPVSGLWWNSSESGWGIYLVQRGSNIFAAWFTYDASGHPKWYVAPQCSGVIVQSEGGYCTGSVYEVDGPRFFGQDFQSIASNEISEVGTLLIDFFDGSMTYTVAGVTRTVTITRESIALDPTTPVPPAANIDYTDLWWNPSESGWGLGVTQQGNNIFLAWYVYDSNGKPTWFVAPNCIVRGSACSGTLYRTLGPPFGPTFPPVPASGVFEAGSATVTFTDPNNATFSYTVDGVSGSKSITRELF